jgi:Flp pilus assembly protein TadB
MSKVTKEAIEPYSSEERKLMNTTFLLLFPALIIAIIAVYYSTVIMSAIAIALALYQFIMIRKFVEDYYIK